MKKVSAAVPTEQYAAWGTKIANDYLTGGTPLKDGVLRVARENHLNPEQIKRVSENANIAAYNQLLPKRDGGDVRFDPVRGADVVRGLNQPEEVSQISVTDYNSLPPQAPAGQPKVASLHSVPESYLRGGELIKEAEDRSTQQGLSHRACLDLLGKLETVREEFACLVPALELKEKVAHGQLEEQVRLAILDHHAPEDIFKVALAGRPEQREFLCEIFGGAFSKLACRGYIKIGDMVKVGIMLPPQLISNRLKQFSPGVDVQVVNGSHPIFASIDTIADIRQERLKNNEGLRISDEKIKKAKKALVELMRGSREARAVGGLTLGGR